MKTSKASTQYFSNLFSFINIMTFKPLLILMISDFTKDQIALIYFPSWKKIKLGKGAVRNLNKEVIFFSRARILTPLNSMAANSFLGFF